jgi:predicted RNA-binding protein Jag
MDRIKNSEHQDEKTDRLIQKIESDLRDSIMPVSLKGLNAFERRQVHHHFDRSDDVVTKTYKISEEEQELRLYPVANLQRYAEKKAQEAMQTGQKVVLPPMSSYERFVIHEALKGKEAVKTHSEGEGEERHVVLEPELFGRGLKKIIKKIKLF